MKKLQKVFTKERYLVWLSLLSTPFILFIITSLDLYSKNHEDLNNKLIVLTPFVVVSVATAAVGYLFYRYSEKRKIFKVLLYIYYLIGPLFLVYSSMHQTTLDINSRVLILLTLFAVAFTYLYKKIEVSKAAKIFFVLSAIMILSEFFTVFKTVYIAKVANTDPLYKSVVKQEPTKKKLPNIYHIIFDEYQSDMFNATLNQKVKDDLGGFTYYPETASVYGTTVMSLPSIFSGRSYDGKIPISSYQMQAFNSDKSMLYWLKKDGYETHAYAHRAFTFNINLFDSFVDHKDNSDVRVNDGVYMKLFTSLWMYSNFPKGIAKKVISADLQDQIANQRVLTGAAPVISYESLKNISNNDELLDRDNQYLFIHVILPHIPYVLKSDCSYSTSSNMKSSPLEQSECATKMMTGFIDSLKKVGRFNNSLIIIQSDHGAKFRVEGNKLIEIGSEMKCNKCIYPDRIHCKTRKEQARYRALLLIKTPDTKDTEKLAISKKKETLLNIAPTIFDAIGIKANMNFAATPIRK